MSLATSWVLVSRLERVGERLKLSEALLCVVAAVAADAPEITASITALAHHQATIGAGVVLGSNVFNLAALFGLGAVVAGRIRLHRKVVVLGGAVALLVAVTSLSVLAASARREQGWPWSASFWSPISSSSARTEASLDASILSRGGRHG